MKQFILVPAVMAMAITAAAQQQPPREWIDPDTGHRVIRLSDEPGSAEDKV